MRLLLSSVLLSAGYNTSDATPTIIISISRHIVTPNSHAPPSRHLITSSSLTSAAPPLYSNHIRVSFWLWWLPTGRTFTIDGTKSPLTRITSTRIVPPKETSQKRVTIPNPAIKVVQIVLWYLDSGCSKHMTRNYSQLINFVHKFFGTVRCRNDQIVKIMGYGDYQIQNVTISRVYYVEGLGHNLFSLGQFCGFDLEVAFRKHTYFVRNLEGVDILKGLRGSNLYTLSIEDMMKSSRICLLSKASKT
ncbi:hypothetical protein Tco_0174610, partial [Tanacetum coccineum]